jgi:hypothetical protein
MRILKSLRATAVLIPILAGCSHGPSKRQLAAAIDDAIKQQSCFALRDKSPKQWPIRVSRDFDNRTDPIVAAMQRAGYVDVRHQSQYFESIDVIDASDEARKWWDAQNGFCVGTKTVADVQEWTLPGEQSEIPIEVTYTWHLTDVPSWAKRSEFYEIEGMKTPVKATAVLRKTSNGWRVVL